MKTIGVILLLLGLAMTIKTGIQITAKDFLKVTPKQINNPNKIAFYWSPITALALITAGVIVLVITTKEQRTVRFK